MTNQISIGGRIVSVPPGYVRAEAAYCKEELAVFHIRSLGPKKELAREEVLAKRIEFYDRYVAGLIKIAEPKQRTIWKKLARWSLGHEWNK